MTRSRQTADWGSRAGLAKIVPSSVAVGSGTGSADSLGTVTFTTVSSVSLNGVFSSTYTNYRIVVMLDASAASAEFDMRMRVSGSDNSSANYTWTRYGSVGSNGAYSSAYSGTSLSTFFRLVPISGTYSTGAVIDVIAPFDSSYNTSVFNQGGYMDTVTGNWFMGNMGGIMSVTTSYDGFTIFPNTGNLTGTVSVYGYTK